MADIINLRRARKAKARAEKEQQAAENRALHGRSSAEKNQGKAEQAAERRRIDGHLRDHSGSAKDDGAKD